MESASSSGSGSGGGPAPFLLKTYDMIDESSTNEIVSWSTNKNSFVVWNPPEFARILLPTYFKHNNFSSFIRQLNTYEISFKLFSKAFMKTQNRERTESVLWELGFRKIDPERWEFSNEDFIKDKKHLLKNIHRRKPIHSHSNPQGSSVDPERVAFEEEIARLSREKAALEANILRFKQQRSTAKLQLEELTQRVNSMEQRQDNLLSFLQKAIQNPTFVENLGQKFESMDISVYTIKRRKQRIDQSKPVVESSLLDNSSSCSRPEFGNLFHRDFSSKLRLELSPSVSNTNLVLHSTQSSNEDGGSPQKKISEATEGNLYVPETLEVSDTVTSFTFKTGSSFSQKVLANDSTRVNSLQQRLTSTKDVDGHVSCHLNLTLSSSHLQVNKGLYSSRMPIPSNDPGQATELRYSSNDKESSDSRLFPNKRNLGNEDISLSSSQETPNNNPGPAAASARVNDVFWEQFLTERPGSSDNEEASSSYRANPYEEQDRSN